MTAPVIVAGGSLAGLALAGALHRRGWPVRVIERAAGPPRDRGAGLGLDLALLEAALGADGLAAMPRLPIDERHEYAAAPFDGAPPRHVRHDRSAAQGQVSAWQHLHAALAAAWPGTPEYGATLADARADASGVQVMLEDGRVLQGAALLGADGHASRVLPQVDAQARSVYAGYLLWRGFVDETALDAGLRKRFVGPVMHLFAREPFHCVVYTVPGPGGAAEGQRRLNWGWYAAVPDADRRRLLAASGEHDDALVIGAAALPAADRAAWVELAARVWPPEWAELVAATAAAGALFGNVVRERVPATATRGRMAVFGDAAHLLSPITGAGARLALRDALVLEAGLPAAGSDAIEAALARYANEQHATAAAMQRSARGWARRLLRAEPVEADTA